MASGTSSALMTEEEFLALPEDGVERWLVRGELKEWGMTTRNWFHSEWSALLSRALGIWLMSQPKPRGKVLAGDVAFRLRSDAPSVIGADVAYLTPAQAARLSTKQKVIQDRPTLAVEILSPSDTIERINEKLELYMEAGVPLVWVINGYNRTVEVHRPGKVPEFFTTEQELTAEPHLPGFRIPVLGLFEDL